MRRAARQEPNLLFVLGSWQDLPGELLGVASSVSVLFPWGTLLQAAATSDPVFVAALRAVSQPGATVEVVTAIDPATDASELRRLGLDGLNPGEIATAWRRHGFEAASIELPDDHPYQTSWWRRIRNRPGRAATLTRITLRSDRPGPAPQSEPHSR